MSESSKDELIVELSNALQGLFHFVIAQGDDRVQFIRRTIGGSQAIKALARAKREVPALVISYDPIKDEIEALVKKESANDDNGRKVDPATDRGAVPKPKSGGKGKSLVRPGKPVPG